MSDIKKFEPIMPMLPELFANAMPVAIPQMTWQSGFIADFMHNWKLGRIEKASEKEAMIAENKYRLVSANLQTFQEIMTFSSRVQTVFRENEYKCKMMGFAEIKAQLENEKLMIETQTARAELEKTEMENKITKKHLEGMLNDTKT